MTELEQKLVRVEVIAKLFGVTVRRVQQLTQEGIIETVESTDGRGMSCRRYEIVTITQNYIKYLSDRAYGKAKGFTSNYNKTNNYSTTDKWKAGRLKKEVTQGYIHV